MTLCICRLFCLQTSQRVRSLCLMLNMVGVGSHWSWNQPYMVFLWKCIWVLFYSMCVFYTVIDFCLVRQLVCDKETNYRSLCITWASKTSCNQRRGTTHVHWCWSIQGYDKLSEWEFAFLLRSCRTGIQRVLLQAGDQALLGKRDSGLYNPRDAGE